MVENCIFCKIVKGEIPSAKIYEDVGTKSLREEGIERKAAPKIIGKSIARYLLAGKTAQAQDLAYQVIFMKEEDPFLSLQIETAISSKRNVIRGFLVSKYPAKIDENNKTLLEMEGLADMGGNIPAWIINMFLVDGPVGSINSMRKVLSK